MKQPSCKPLEHTALHSRTLRRNEFSEKAVEQHRRSEGEIVFLAFVDTLDPECPKMSPNYYDVCPMLDRFRDHAAHNNITLEADDFSHDVYEFDLLSIFGKEEKW
ncbi:unnamed protein product [Heligmosomoides polygyrus]|uniref:DUF3800 domain-containing protein n=1 Tax=Heligmosomoides polygyrus TaxID=6339 RepID=A0A183F3I2_HELPZ|nr:unnamed protein product [Heligmosomoides polygyrus]